MVRNYVEIRRDGPWYVATVQRETDPPIELARALFVPIRDSAEVRNSFLHTVRLMVEHVIKDTGGEVTE
jgi:hypothetical protein